MSVPIDWQREARRIVQVELARKDIGYKELSRALETVCGVDIDSKALAKRSAAGPLALRSSFNA